MLNPAGFLINMNYPIKEQLGVNIDKYRRIKLKALTAMEKASICGEEFPEVLKFASYLEDLKQCYNELFSLFTWTPEWYEKFLKQSSFESGNNVGAKTLRTRNCPYCGFTPLDKQYCYTCEKHVIFEHTKDFPAILEVTDELIITRDYTEIKT